MKINGRESERQRQMMRYNRGVVMGHTEENNGGYDEVMVGERSGVTQR